MTSQDLVKGLDMTDLSEVGGAQINQQLDTGRLGADKGMRIITEDTALDTPDVPNPNVELEGVTPTWWTRYAWIRLPFPGSAGTIKHYDWNEELTSDTTFLKWQEFADIEGLQEQIDEALADSAAAVVTANAASATATTALNTVTSLVADVAIAQQTADQALATANTANTTAQEASTTANTALTTATTANSAITALAANLRRTPRAVFYFREQQNQGVDSVDTPIAATWVKRTFNIITENNSQFPASSYCDLQGDSTIVLHAGFWEVSCECPGNGGATGGFHRTRLVNIADTANPLLYGSSEYADTTIAATKSSIIGYIELSGSTTVEIDHIMQNSIAGGFGKATNLGGPEIYSQLVFKYLGT